MTQLLPDIPLDVTPEELHRSLTDLRDRLENILEVTLGITESSSTNIADLLESTVLVDANIKTLQEDVDTINDELDAIDLLFDALLGNPAIADINNTAITASGAYVQSELQQVADDTEVVSDKLDTLLATLRSAGVLNV